MLITKTQINLKGLLRLREKEKKNVCMINSNREHQIHLKMHYMQDLHLANFIPVTEIADDIRTSIGLLSDSSASKLR